MVDSAPCPTCAAELPSGSRLCPHCGGRPAADGETLELTPDPVLPDPPDAPEVVPNTSPLAVHQAHRRPMGIHPVPLLAGIGLLGLLVAIILLAVGALAAGLILLALAIAVLTLFAGGVRREPDAPAARLTLAAADRLRVRTRFAAVAGGAWGRAGLDLLRIRRRQHRLRSQLKASLGPLGEAVHHDDQERAESLKRRAADLERKLDDSEHAATEVVAGARREIQRERTRA